MNNNEVIVSDFESKETLDSLDFQRQFEFIQAQDQQTIDDLMKRSAVNFSNGVSNRQQKRNFLFGQPMGDDFSNKEKQRNKAKSKTRAKNKASKKARKRK